MSALPDNVIEFRFSLDDDPPAQIDRDDCSAMDRAVYERYLKAFRSKYKSEDFKGCTNAYTHERILTRKDFDKYLRELAYHKACEDHFKIEIINTRAFMREKVSKFEKKYENLSYNKQVELEKQYAEKQADADRQVRQELSSSRSALTHHFRRLTALIIVLALVLSGSICAIAIPSVRSSAESAASLSGYEKGYAAGVEDTQNVAYNEGYSIGYEKGKVSGYEAAQNPAPTRSAAPAEQPSAVDVIPLPTVTSADTVYVTATGTKYHRAGCSYLTSSEREISLSDAVDAGYTPCSRCKPPS